ncbi:MAG: RNA polymerase sigma factor [Planctomycetota bacterium]|nr:RNA polymerase sigma factor [Planctomycetota bacterium]
MSSEVVIVPQELEKQLIERFRSGDSYALATLFESYSKRLFWVAFNILRNYDDALDAVQETFIRILNAISRFDTSKRFYTWACQIIINLCVDKKRRISGVRAAVSLEDVGLPPARQDPSEDGLSQNEKRNRVFTVMGKMPESYRTVLILREMEGLGCKEISEMLATTHATIRWRLHRARRLFRRIWEKEFGKES